jgi:glucosyl-dolichyl phosphate glucuronosyltransferase
MNTPSAEPCTSGMAAARPGSGSSSVRHLTVLICTYNRAADLRKAVHSAVGQQGLESGAYEVIVVDNNSTDGTRDVVAGFGPPTGVELRYYFEQRQGKSHALNTGLSNAAGAIVSIIDDDQIMPPNYAAELLRLFGEHPEASFIGGKVLPVWESEPPTWLTSERWSPIGMSDYGDEPFLVNAKRPVCLLTCAFRLADLNAVGGFRTELGVTGSAMGSTEDAELLERLWSSGRPGRYEPSLVLRHLAPARRLTQSYYRRWHRGHGRYSALRREPSVERSSFRVLDVPSHMYRQAVLDGMRWVSRALRRDREAAFNLECSLCFFSGFLAQRTRECFASLRGLPPRDTTAR